MRRPWPREIRDIRDSGLFDADWYRRRYPDVELMGLDPVEHYFRVGALLGRDPGPGFDTGHYLRTQPDVAAGGDNPLLHYVRHGRLEGRQPRPPGAAAAPMPQSPGPRRDRVRVPEPEVLAHGRAEAGGDARTVLVCAHVAGSYAFGGERSLLDLLDGFAMAGMAAVVSVPGRPSAGYLQALAQRCRKVVLVPQRWWRDASALDEAVVAAFAALVQAEGIEAVHANTIMIREPVEAARRMGVPGVVHVREIVTADPDLCAVIGHEPAAIIEEVRARADLIVANSRATEAVFGGDRCHVVPNTVDADLFDLAPPQVGSPLRVGMISSNVPKKGLSDFVEVARRLEADGVGVEMVLFGPETEPLRAALDDGGAPGNLRFAGYRSRPGDAVAELDVVLNLSSFQESFGRTVLEAMTGSRAVVAYDWGALGELVDDGRTGFLVPYRDVAAVAARIAELASDPGRVLAMGTAGRERAASGFTIRQLAGRLAEAYRGLWDGYRPHPLTLPARRLPEPVLDRPLRIAYFLWWFPAPSETFVLNELRELVAAGHDVEVFCRQSPFPDFSPDFDIRWTRVDGPDALAAALREGRRDIVHSHFVYPTVTDMVWPACEQAGIDFTFIAHAQDIFRHANDAKNRIGEIAASPRCRRVLVPSRFHRDYLVERGVERHKLFINPNGMDPGLYPMLPRPDAGRRRRSVCAVHRFVPKKGLEHLLRAAPALDRLGVDIHLYGYGDLEADYRAIVEQLQSPNVRIHGPVKGREALLDVFAAHDLFACPSVRAADGDMDGIPTVVMEAMAAGLPVLVTPLSGIPELVADGVNGLYCEPDPGSIAAAVGRFLALPAAEVEAMRRAARDTVTERFSTPRLVAGLVRLWRNQTFDAMVVSWNNLPELSEVLERLQANTSLPWHLVVCDNGSRGDVAAWLCAAHAAWPNFTLIYNRDNSLVGPGTNACLQAGRSDYAVYVCGKEGFTFEQGWERPLIDYMDDHPEVGQAGTLAHSPTYLTGRDYPTGVRVFERFRDRDFATSQPDRRFAHVQGGFFVLRRRMVEAIGGFSEQVPHDYTDVEYSLHVEASGWRLGRPPGLLALYNKSRPDLFSRIDESMLAIHPPTLAQLPLLDAITGRRTRFCNVCGWHGDAFGAEQGCPGCGSTPADRSLYRFVSESTLVYRRLLGLGIGPGRAMAALWAQQFRGECADRGPLDAGAVAALAPARLDGRVDVIYLDADAVAEDALDFALDAVLRQLSPRGVLALRFGHRLPDPAREEALVEALARRLGAVPPEPVRFRSEVVRYDPRTLWVLRRSESSQCVY